MTKSSVSGNDESEGASAVGGGGVVVPNQTGFDLRALFRSVGRFSPQRGLLSTPIERVEPDVPAELLDSECSRVNASACEVGAFVDGIQAAASIAYIDHRPVYLIYVAAGAVGPSYRPVGLREELFLACGTVDRQWADQLDGGVPIEELLCATPIEIETAALKLLAGRREANERELTVALGEQEVGNIIVDGSLSGRGSDPALMGVVKSLRHRYLADESCLFGLRAGWRSPRFKIPAGVAGGGVDRFSAYVRMVDASRAPWDFGLIRVETFDPDLIDGLAARCLSERQGSRSGDSRWDRHIAGVHKCEEFLRARRPSIFTR